MSVERYIRNTVRERLPPRVKSYLWLFYTDAKRVKETGSFGGFSSVQVEINTHCNRTCSYCTNSVHAKDQRLIDRDLFNKIVDELGVIGFKGRFCPNLSSEPMLHPDLPELTAYARGKMPKANIVLYTNGDFLDRCSFDKLRKAGISEFIITQHGEIIPDGLKSLLAALNSEEQKMTVFQKLESVNLFNRGIPGLVPDERRTRPNPCYVAQNDLTILVDGSVTLCGNDVFGENIFGNVRDQNIMDIWNNPEYKRARQELRKRQVVFSRDICNRCVN